MTAIPAITIEREYGSGGGAVGRRLAASLAVPYYGKDLMAEAAVQAGISPKEAFKLEEESGGPLARMVSSAFMMIPGVDPEADYLYEIQSELIRERARSGPAVFIGRLAQDALKESGLDYIRVFITRPLEARVNQIEKLENLSPKKAAKLVKEFDQRREARARYYGQRRWGDAREYDLTLNSADLGEDGCIEVIKKYLELRARRRRARGIKTRQPGE
ncbi:MAG: AAA family ATPase [Eubacteriaceae bacterium]|jgi:cytidylate kinase